MFIKVVKEVFLQGYIKEHFNFRETDFRGYKLYYIIYDVLHELQPV